jgi:hypothetical protein
MWIFSGQIEKFTSEWRMTNTYLETCLNISNYGGLIQGRGRDLYVGYLQYPAAMCPTF